MRAGGRVTARTYGAFKGLDPEAEWLLDPPRPLNLPPSEFRLRGAAAALFRRQTLANAAAPDALDTVPFAFTLSPVEGGPSGAILLAALDAVAQRLRRSSVDFRFNMSVADRDRLRQGKAAGALCDQIFFDALEGSDFAAMPKTMRLSSALRGAAAPADVRASVSTPDNFGATLMSGFGPGFSPSVVLGVIDDDFAIAHPRLRRADDTTRIASYWDQDADFDPAGAVPLGRELTKPALDTLLTMQAPLPEWYAQPALAEFYPFRRNTLPRHASHGTHVLDLLAGAEPGEADDRPVIAVKLPRASVLDTSGAHLEFFLLQAVHHIVSRAQMLVAANPTTAGKPKVVIVASYGFFGGPLDGASQFQRALDQVIAEHDGRVQIVLPSGNGRLARTRADIPPPTAATPTALQWRLAAGDRTPSVMEIWSEPITGTAAEVALTVTTPDGMTTTALTDVDTTNKIVVSDATGAEAIIVVCEHPALHPGRRLFLVWLGPTADPPLDVTPKPGLVPPGVWTVTLTTLGAAGKPRQVWIHRDDSLPGYPRLGRQSSVERPTPATQEPPTNATHAERDPPADRARRAGTLNTIASGGRAVIVGGFSLATRRAAPSSAGGPVAPPPPNLPNPPATPPGWRQGPDCLAPSQVSPLRGVKAAGFFGGTRVAFAGTSAATPLVGRALADDLAKTAPAVGLDGRAATASHAIVSEAKIGAPYAAWKPDAARGGSGRFLDARMMRTVFRLDGIP